VAKFVDPIESLLQDFRFGLRMISKYRKASLAAIASLALAVGPARLRSPSLMRSSSGHSR
jgi:hypothetical protein